MGDWVSDLTSSLSSVFQQEDSIQRVAELIKNLGVCSAEDLKYVEANDLSAVLKPIEVRKVMDCIKQMTEDDSSSLLSSQIEEASTGEESFMSDNDDNFTGIHSTPKSTATRSPASVIAVRSQASPTTSESGSSPFVREDGSWHYSFDVPWSKIPSNTMKVLDAEKRPSAVERREIIRIVVAEILTVCKKPGKRHITEIARKMIDESFEESTVTKFRRILQYYQFVKTEPSSRAGTILGQAMAGGDATCAAVLMLLAHFNEQEDKMFLNVDDTAIATDLDTSKLPWTPCIVVCGNSPLTAKMFMVAVDQVIVNEQLPCFTKAFHMMFCSYYLHNIDYPVELAATMEFLQRINIKEFME
ncbi:hypothetical protein SKAU_G00058310 [Synaphobranchus kaupii]|uniref:Uncharacterized protein n=1 Tax=Synaphobranchus kaupii TaxID=118154 RepID=A0A9Q1G4V6_SYNKA|nr:hypothetical protein SKAU_G00058310 [Synaphobranchus kaupii]